MRVLVTGGAGFIGANLVRMLLDHDYQVTVLDNLSTGRREYLDGQPIEFIEGDILDADLVNRVVPGHDDIVHLAAQTGVPGSLADPRRDCEVNVVGTLNLLEACRHVTDGESGRWGEGEIFTPSTCLPLTPSVHFRFFQRAPGPPAAAGHRGQSPPPHFPLRGQ